jgi:hypothetical protein
VHENESEEEVSDCTQHFVPHGMQHPRFSFLGVSGVNADYDDGKMWQLFGEQIYRVFHDLWTLLQGVISYVCDHKSLYKNLSDFGRLRSYGHFLIPVHALV